MYQIIINISVFILLLPIVVGFIRYQRLGRDQKTLLWMICIVATNQFISWAWSIWIMPENNLPFFYVYILIEFLFLSFIYFKRFFPHSPRPIRLIWPGIVLSIWLLIFLWPGAMWTYPDLLRAIEGIVLILFAALYFLQVFKEGTIVRLTDNFLFWVSAGILVYFASNILLFLYSDLIAEQRMEVFELIWMIHSVLTILLYFSFTLALRCQKKMN